MTSALRSTFWVAVLLGILATGCSRAAGAQSGTTTRLLPYLQYAAGTTATADVLAGRAAFSPAPEPALRGWPANFWIRFTLRPLDISDDEWLLVLPNVERAELYAPGPHGAPYVRRLAGTSTALVERSLPFITPSFALSPATPRDAPIYVHIVYHPDQAFAPAVRTQQEAFARGKVARLVQGIFLGAMLAVVFFNLYAFFGLREYPAIFFVLYAAALLVNELVATGIGAEYFWPRVHNDQRLGVLITNSLGFVSFLMFARAFLMTRATVRTLDRVIIGMLALQLSVAFVQYALPVGRALVVPLLAIEFASATFMAYIGIVRWRQGFRPARFFVIAFIPSTAGVLANLLYDAFLPSGNWFAAAYGVEFGIVLQAIVISFSVIDRLYTLDRERRRAQHIASTDALTNIANRLAFFEAIHASIASARIGDQFGILFIDLDGFKPVNDRYGHRVGDELLRIIAQRLATAVRSDDLVARLGGDEFAVLLRRAPSIGLVRRIAEGARASITEPMIIDGAFVRVGASIGLALFPENGTTPDELLDSADSEMYAEKQRRKNVLHISN